MQKITPKPDKPSHHNAQTSWQHSWRLSWPTIVSNITVPLDGVIVLTLIRRFNDPAFISSVGLGIMEFNFRFFRLGFLHMGTTGLVAQIYGTGPDTAIGHLLVHGVSVALVLGKCLFWPVGQSALGNIKEEVYSLAQIIGCTLPYLQLDSV